MRTRTLAGCMLEDDRHRVADVLRRMKKSRVLLALGYWLASLASSVMGSVLHKDFTLRRTIILAVLDARMNLTPSLTTTCVPDCTTSFSLSGDTDGGTRVVDCETLAEGVLFPDPFVSGSLSCLVPSLPP